MLLIRKFVGYGATAVGLGVICALALVQAGEAAGPPTHVSGQASLAGVELQAATPSPQCTAAMNAINAASTKDTTEDATEPATANTKPDPAAEISEDKAEAAAMKTLRDAARVACLPPATPQCTAARQAVQAARTHDQSEDASERALAKTAATEAAAKAEDQAEGATLKPLTDAVHAACGRQKPASTPPSSQCVVAQNALKAAKDRDKTEDPGEVGTKGTAADKTEDQPEASQIHSLTQAMDAACGHGGKHGDSSFER